jgi:hypothetical protein
LEKSAKQTDGTGSGIVKTSYLFVYLIGTLLLAASSLQAVSLSRDDAEALIVQHFGYPVLAPHVTVCGELDSFVWKGFERLVEQGYLAPNLNRGFQYEPRFVPTEKGKPYIRRGPTFNVLLRDYCMQVYVSTVVFKGITRIEVDEAQGRAHVEYRSGLEPVQPFYLLFCADSPAPGCRPYAGRKLAETTAHTVIIQQTNNGWRVVKVNR